LYLTDYETHDGAVTLVDCMPPRSKEADLVQLIIGKRGQVRMRMQLIIRFDYGSIVPWVRAANNGIQAIGGPDTLVLKTNVDFQSEGPTITAEFTVSEGERIPFVLMWHPSHEPRPSIVDAEEMITQTGQWWQRWSNRCTYKGPWRDAGIAFADYSQDAHLCTDRRNCRGGDYFVA
jgi:GH15 family glucan-1,4-alpha-glucosidase